MKSDLWTDHRGSTDYINIRKRIEKGIEMVKKYKRVKTEAVGKIKIIEIAVMKRMKIKGGIPLFNI